MPLQQLIADKSLSELLSYLVDKLGIREADVIRALRLAKKAQIIHISNKQAIVLVPSQRLHTIPREKVVPTADLYSLLQGHYRIRSVKVGKLPADQQWYRVVIQREKAECTCPDTIYNRNPLCIHKLAAAILLYLRRRNDLLHWLETIAKPYGRLIREKKTPTSRSRAHDQT